MGFSSRGIFQKPNETPEAFKARAEWIIEQSQNRDPRYSWAKYAQLQPARQKIQSLFEVDPDWIPVFYSDEDLPFWMGGCTWLIQDDPTGWTRPVIQLKKAFETNERIWGLYSRNEILAHEMVHACRVQLEDSPYEEILAYETSQSALRRWLGPLFDGTREQWIFIGMLGLAWVGCFFSLAWTLPLAGYLTYLFARMVKRRRELKKVPLENRFFV